MNGIHAACCAVLVTSSAVIAGDEVVAPLPARHLAAQLSSDSYTVRQQATIRLGAAGREAVDPLLAVASGDNLEAAVRAVEALEDLFVRASREQDLATADAAEIALEQISASKNSSVARRATVVLTLRYALRERRAFAQLGELGAIVGVHNQESVPGAEGPDQPYVVIGRSWKGGDEGLAVMRRLVGRRIDLYICRSKNFEPVSKNALDELAAAAPLILQHYRGEAYLGVQGGPNGLQPGGRITGVMRGKAADLAGLRQEDLIRKVDGEPLVDFESLVKYLAEKAPGDVIELEIVRGSELLVIPVKLGSWTPE